MSKIRIIARLDVKGPNVIKGVHLECLRVVGNPAVLAEKYYLDGADELIYMDVVASLYGRQNLLSIVNQTSDKIFIPFTVGGGIRKLDDIKEFLKAGADKVAINTAATKNPQLIRDAAETFGSQCIVGSIESKKVGPNKWEAYTDNGREKTGLDVIEWAKKLEDLGAGEILLTSIDTEGTKKGYDLHLIQEVSKVISIPLVVSGGVGSVNHLVECAKEYDISGMAVASILHYNLAKLKDLKKCLKENNLDVRII